jgi:tRNA A37 threonylcarbamoyladenosine synthetase subunit TsaC/SUA5/YrdC
LFSETVALRCPDDPFLHELFRLLNYRVLVAPSANVSGQENIYTCNELMRTFRGKVHHIVCLKSETKGTKASTIIDVSRGAWKILREGGLHIDVKELQSDEKRG